MSKPKPDPGKSTPTPVPRGVEGGLVAKLKGFFVKSATRPSPSTPAPKKGQSSFLKNFKVKGVGAKEEGATSTAGHSQPVPKPSSVEPAWSKHLQESQAGSKAPSVSQVSVASSSPVASTGKPLSTPYTGKISLPAETVKKPQSTIVGPDDDDQPVAKTESREIGPISAMTSAKGKPQPKESSPPAPKSPAQMMLPKAFPETETVLPKPDAPSSVALPKPVAAPKPPQLLPVPPVLSQPKRVPPPSPASTPAPKARPSFAAPSLLPGQKQGDEIGRFSGATQILLKPASGSPVTRGDSLPSLPAKPGESQAKVLPKPAIVKRSEPKPAIVKGPAPKPTPAPDTRRTSTGTLKKESLRLKPLPSGDFKPMVTGKSEPGKRVDSPAPLKPAGTAEPKSTPQTKAPAQPEKAPAAKASALLSAVAAANPAAPKAAVKEPAKSSPSAKSTGIYKGASTPKPSGKRKAAAASAAARPSQKKKPKVVLPPRREDEKKTSPLLFLIPLLILLLGGIAFALYWQQRETSVVVTVESGDLTLRGDSIVVMNFAGKLQMLRDDYFRRRAPLEEEIKRIKANLAAAQGDLAGREQRKKLLDDALEQYQAEIPQFLTESQQALNSLWEDKSDQLAREYDQFKESLHQEIIGRAEELGVDYQRNTEIDAIAVAVNAFRLALYGVAREVDVSEQRAWAEDLLQRWNAYEKEWRDAQTAIKKEALEIKKQPLPKIADARKRIDNLQREIAAVEIDLQSLRDEVARHEETFRVASRRLADVDDPFFLELQAIPKEFEVARFAVENNGVIRMSRLEQSEELSEGTHFLLVRAVKEDTEYWAVDEFEILPYQSVESTVRSDQFVPLRKILEEGTFMKP